MNLAALSIARGNGKTTLAGWLLAEHLRKRDGRECVLLAGSISQSRLTFRVVRSCLGDAEWKFQDSATMLGCHPKEKSDLTRLRVLSSNAKTAFGLGLGTSLVIGDEPGTWEVAGGQLMFDALKTSLGKPGSDMRVILIGTRAPAIDGWWLDLLDGDPAENPAVHVSTIQCSDREKWDQASEIRRCNPLMWRFPKSRKTLLEERDAARRDSRMRAQFLSFRLNLPTGDEAKMLVDPAEWAQVEARPAADREGSPVVGIDLGGGRAWSAAVAVWRSGRVEAAAVCPGVPSIAEQERRDQVPRGSYQRLVEQGTLTRAAGVRVPPPSLLMQIAAQWRPALIVCDRFRLPDLQDASPPCRVLPRVSRWSESSFDIRALRRMASDGPLSIAPVCRDLLLASIARAVTKTDDAGNFRLVKRGTNNIARDDVAAALTLAAGAAARRRDVVELPYMSA